MSLVSSSSLPFSSTPTFSLPFCCWYSCRDPSCCPSRLWPNRTLGSFGLPNAASSHSVFLFLLDHITLPLLVCFLFIFSFDQSSLLSHAGLLISFSDFLVIGLGCYWAWRSWSLGASQVFQKPFCSGNASHGILPSRSLRGQSLLYWNPGLWLRFFPCFLLSGPWAPLLHGHSS